MNYRFLAWSPEYGETVIDAVKIVCPEHHGPREAAARWAEWRDQYSAEYAIVGKSLTVRVLVQDMKDGKITEWDVTGEAVPHYSARSAVMHNARRDAPEPSCEPGKGDDVPCEKCGAVALDTGLECTECGHDNYEAVTGEPFGA